MGFQIEQASCSCVGICEEGETQIINRKPGMHNVQLTAEHLKKTWNAGREEKLREGKEHIKFVIQLYEEQIRGRQMVPARTPRHRNILGLRGD